MNNPTPQQPFQPPPEWVAQLQHTVNTVAEQQKSLMMLMRGNAMNPDDKGVLGTVAQLKKDHTDLALRIASLEKERDRAIAWMAGALAIGGLSVTIIYTVLKHIFPIK